MIADFIRRILDQVERAVAEGHYRDFARAHKPPGEVPSLEAAVRRDAPWAFLAEVKPASPTGPLGRGKKDVERMLALYRDHAVTGISVLTERDTFGGSLELLREAARPAPDGHRVPVLMKDFIVHDDQLAAAQAAGASAVLLLDRLVRRGLCAWDDLAGAIDAAHGHGLEVLLEVDDARAFEHAVTTRAEVIGINNRDLGTLEMDPDRAVDILRHRLHLVRDTPVLALSGIRNRDDVAVNHQGGATGVLVGTSLMTSEDPRGLLRSMRGIVHVKCCGAGHPEDTPEAIRALAAADAVGAVVLTPDAPRDRDPGDVRRLFRRLPDDVEKVLVSAHRDVDELAALAAQTGAASVQWHRDADAQGLAALRDALAPGTAVIAVLRLDADGGPAAASAAVARARALAGHADRLLVDARPPAGGPPGGTGKRVDVATAAAVQAALRPFPVVLAGGLDAANVQAAVARVRPWGVDVSSGTEAAAAPGRKDPARVWAVLRAARQVRNLHDEHGEEVDRLRVL